MDYLFSYGTIQEESIQNAVFNRKLKGRADTLPGFKLSESKAYGRYLMVVKTNDVSQTISGKVYELEGGELELADAYEGNEYQRILVDLTSGKKAWLYVGA